MGKKLGDDICVVGSALVNHSKAVFQEGVMANKEGRYDIGACHEVRIKCVSESGSKGPESRKHNGLVKKKGDFSSSPEVDSESGAGNCALIEIEMLSGRTERLLFDCGGADNDLDKCLRREGIDHLLRQGDLISVVVSHEHRDNAWGLGALLRYNSKITIYTPSTFDPKRFYCLVPKEFGETQWTQHAGTLVRLRTREIVKLCEGCVAITFKCISHGQRHSETSLCFLVKDAGLVLVSGCCHQGMRTLASFVGQKIEGGEKLYGFYGGLHIAPYGHVSAEGEAEIKSLAECGFSKIACNHCTGDTAIKRMLSLGYPVARGAAWSGSDSHLHLGEGEMIVFG
jgi:7,8-dihydropterin-6-yl-methyl-4-(beta-D-ribofuranosyl)aminobenzene 5'-phosphate synthase